MQEGTKCGTEKSATDAKRSNEGEHLAYLRQIDDEIKPCVVKRGCEGRWQARRVAARAKRFEEVD